MWRVCRIRECSGDLWHGFRYASIEVREMILIEEERKVRPCLRCSKGFLTDSWHRICKRCHRRIRREHVGRLAVAYKVPLDNAFKSAVLNTRSDGAIYEFSRYRE